MIKNILVSEVLTKILKIAACPICVSLSAYPWEPVECQHSIQNTAGVQETYLSAKNFKSQIKEIPDHFT